MNWYTHEAVMRRGGLTPQEWAHPSRLSHLLDT